MTDKGIPIECMQELFEGSIRHAAWRQKSVYPPYGLPPIPHSLVLHDPTLEGLEAKLDAKIGGEERYERRDGGV